MGKEYGKLTEDQFQRFIGLLSVFRQEAKETEDHIRSLSPEKRREVLGDGLSWAHYYEMPLVQVVGAMIHIAGLADRFLAASQSPDPQELMLQEPNDQDIPDWDGGPGGAYAKSDLIAIMMAVLRNAQSLMIYKRSICALVADVREGNDEALFNANRPSLSRSPAHLGIVASSGGNVLR